MTIKKLLIIVLVLAGLIGAGVLGGLMYIGMAGPESRVVGGNLIAKHHLKIINDLKLLQPGEHIQYFYSDALVNIRKGMYFVTDRRLVLYCKSWEKPRQEVPFQEIEKVEAQLQDSFWDDSTVQVTLKNGEVLEFPLSNEKGGSRRFFDYLKSKVPQATAVEK
jgi:hypothetical protein